MELAPAIVRLRDIHKGELSKHIKRNPLGSNNVKYNTWWYKRKVSGDRYKWCAVYQSWCMQLAGVDTSIFPRSASCKAIRDWYRKKDRFFSKPKVGDLVIYKNRSTGRPNHIGFVEKLISDNRIQTIEGNYGDRVTRRKVKISDGRIDGFCRPDYAATKEPEKSAGGVTEAILQGLPNLVLGAKGPDVRRLHALLRAAGQPLPGNQNSDGTFKSEYNEVTRGAVRAVTGRTTITGAQWKQLLGV